MGKLKNLGFMRIKYERKTDPITDSEVHDVKVEIMPHDTNWKELKYE